MLTFFPSLFTHFSICEIFLFCLGATHIFDTLNSPALLPITHDERHRMQNWNFIYWFFLLTTFITRRMSRFCCTCTNSHSLTRGGSCPSDITANSVHWELLISASFGLILPPFLSIFSCFTPFCLWTRTLCLKDLDAEAPLVGRVIPQTGD